MKDGYLVDFLSVETKLKFMEQGIVYDDLSDADKRAYEDTFEDENGELPDSIASSALNEWIFNEDTIRQVLNTLMTHGLTIDYGNKLGKTIIFAKITPMQRRSFRFSIRNIRIFPALPRSSTTT